MSARQILVGLVTALLCAVGLFALPSGGAAAEGHVLTGYWQNFTNDAKPMRLADVSDKYDIIAVAFADADAAKAGAVTFGVDPDLSEALGGYTDDQLIDDVKTAQGRGQKVILSVGGQNGTITVGDDAAAANFASSVTSIMDEYGFDGVDIDLENGIDPDAMGSALHQIADKAGSGTVITLAPQTIDMQTPSTGYFKLATTIKDILTSVHTQYYNSGSMNGCDGKVYSQGTVDFITAQACTALQNGLDPAQVGVGLPATNQAAGSGYVEPAVAGDALDCLSSGTNCGSFTPPSKWDGVRNVMTWSINWDAQNDYAFANAVKP